MESVLFVVVVIAGLMLYSRISALERAVDILKQQLARRGSALENESPIAAEAIATQSFASQPSKATLRPVYAPAHNFDVGRREDSSWYVWLKQDFLVKVGALLLLLALGWFVSYAFANNWIGPVGRITLGVLTGAAVLILGSIRIVTHQSQGAIFTVLGSTTIILTLTAAQYLYEMFSPFTALFIMAIVAVYVAFVSVRYERSALALASLATAASAPFLIDLVAFDPVLIMTYVLLIVAGTLWVVWYLRTYLLVIAALGVVFVYTPIAYDVDATVALLFSFVFTGIFFVTNLVSMFRHPERPISSLQIFSALATAVYLIGWIFVAAPEQWHSLYLAVWALVFAYGSYLVFAHTFSKLPFYIYGAVSLVLLGTATAVELEGAVLTIMLTLEAVTSMLLVSHIAQNKSALNLTTLTLLVPGLLTLEHMNSWLWQDSILHADMFALLVFTLALIGSGLIHFNYKEQYGDTDKNIIKVLFVTALGYFGILIWLCFHAAFTEGVGTTLSLIVYTISGLVAYVYGRHYDLPLTRSIGMTILGFVVVRLLLIDIWQLDLAGRIITFFIIGVMFVSTAFLPKHQKNLASLEK